MPIFTGVLVRFCANPGTKLIAYIVVTPNTYQGKLVLLSLFDNRVCRHSIPAAIGGRLSILKWQGSYCILYPNAHKHDLFDLVLLENTHQFQNYCAITIAIVATDHSILFILYRYVRALQPGRCLPVQGDGN